MNSCLLSPIPLSYYFVCSVSLGGFMSAELTSCAGDRHSMSPPLQVNYIFVFIRQVAPVPAYGLLKTSATSWPFGLESGVRVTCDVGYLCANFSLPRPLCSRLRPDVRGRRQTDRRQTNVKQHHLNGLMPLPYVEDGDIINRINGFFKRMKRFGYIQRDITVSDLINSSGLDLRKLCAPLHSLHYLLPLLGKCNSLRDRGHPCELPQFSSNLHKTLFVVHVLCMHIWFYVHLILWSFFYYVRLLSF